MEIYDIKPVEVLEVLEPLNPRPAPSEGKPAHNALPDEVKDLVIKAVLESNNISKTAEEFNLNRATVTAIIREFRAEVGEFVDFKYQSRIEKILDKLLRRLESEAGEIKLSQLPVATAILLDKRRELRGKTLNAQDQLNLRVAWKDGMGAVELTTGQGD
ncbi:MAG: hypothetical protein A4E53_00271 [Pelotomaculum sp. PtaB.Bin104]|nr:MAG: hypothetical protein A4E53_00271 [Pelotomaculum sp. PtaB.Bin104]